MISAFSHLLPAKASISSKNIKDGAAALARLNKVCNRCTCGNGMSVCVCVCVCVYVFVSVSVMMVHTCIAFSLSPSHFDSNSGPRTVHSKERIRRIAIYNTHNRLT